MRKAILRFIDFFYPPFSRWITPHTFRYLASGGTTALTGVIVFYIAYNFILKQQDVKIQGLPLITAPTAALIIETVVTLTIGFMLNKYLVFTQSNLKGRIQLFRYGSIVATNFLLNLAMLKILVEAFNFYPSIAKLVTTLVIAVFSYFSQKHFSFKVKK